MHVSLAGDAKHHRIGQFLNWPMNAPPGRSILIQVSPHIKNSGPPNGGPEFLVGVGRLELPASWSRTKRATSCATPRNSFYIIMTAHTIVKRKNRRSPSVPQKERRGTASASRLSLWLYKQSLLFRPLPSRPQTCGGSFSSPRPCPGWLSFPPRSNPGTPPPAHRL